VGAVDPKD
jgi:hypothetical protein